MSQSESKKPKRRVDKSETPVSFLPKNNSHARRGYLCAVVGLVPGLGLVLGPLGLIWGFLGRRTAKRDPNGEGLGHAVMSMVLGATETICNGLGFYLIGSSQNWF